MKTPIYVKYTAVPAEVAAEKIKLFLTSEVRTPFLIENNSVPNMMLTLIPNINNETPEYKITLIDKVGDLHRFYPGDFKSLIKSGALTVYVEEAVSKESSVHDAVNNEFILNELMEMLNCQDRIKEYHSGLTRISGVDTAVMRYLHSLGKDKLKEWVDCGKFGILVKITAIVFSRDIAMTHIGSVNPKIYSDVALIALSKYCSELNLDPASVDVGGTDIAEHLEPLRDYLSGKIDLEYYVKFKEKYKLGTVPSDVIMFETLYRSERTMLESLAIEINVSNQIIDVLKTYKN